MTGESGWLSLRSLEAGGTMLVTGCWDAGSDVGVMMSVGMGWFWLGVEFQIGYFKLINVLFRGFCGEFSVFSDQVFRKALGKWQLGWLADLDVNSGVHGVTRPTTHGLAAMRWVIVG